MIWNKIQNSDILEPMALPEPFPLQRFAPRPDPGGFRWLVGPYEQQTELARQLRSTPWLRKMTTLIGTTFPVC